MKYGYVRVSHPSQKYGTSLDGQREELLQAGAEIIVEEVSSSAKFRPKFDKLVSSLNANDILYIAKLDRFARSVAEGTTIISTLLEKGIAIEILNIGRLDSSAGGKLLQAIMLAFAEYERDMIIERTQEGKARARANGKKVDGRPRKFSEYQMNHAMELLNSHSYSEVERLTNISKSTLTREKRKIKGARSL